MPARPRPLPPLFAALSFLALTVPATAQMRPTLIRDATILTGDGRTIEHGAVLIQGTKIASVIDSSALAKFEIPFLTKKVRAKGKFVTPGLIDVWSTLALRGPGTSDNATARAADSYDRFDSDAIKAALAQGVTAIYVPARGREGFSGIGAVVRLIPGGSAAEVLLKDDAAMCATLGGLTPQKAVGRMGAAANLRRLLEEAKQYREALDYYKEDLEEYEKKIKERAEKEAAEKKDGSKPEEKKEVKREPPKEEPKKPSPPPGGPRRRPPRGVDEGVEDSHGLSDSESGNSDEVDAPFADEPKDKPEGGKPEEKKDDIQKPAEPAREALKEVLLKVLDGDLPLRVTADRPEDILNALEVAEAFNLRLVIEGGTGAHLVADRLAEREAPVVLRAAAATQRFPDGALRYADPAGVATLLKAGCPVYCGSGPGAESRSLALRAAQLVGQGLKAEQALATVTSKAAKLLGVEEQVGRLAPGLSGDVVIWSGHPLSAGARVERVFINGVEVYRAPKPGADATDDEDDDS